MGLKVLCTSQPLAMMLFVGATLAGEPGGHLASDVNQISNLAQSDVPDSYYDEQIRQNPKDASLFWRRAQFFRMRRDGDRALADFNKAIELSEPCSDLFCDRAVFYLECGLPKFALDDTSRAIQLDPSSARAYRTRAFAWGAQKNVARTLKDLDRAIELAPMDWECLVIRAISYRELDRYEECLADLDKALSISAAPNEEIHVCRCQVFLTVVELQKALEDAEAAIRVNPVLGTSYELRGIARMDLGDLDGALSDFTKALQLSPELIDVYTFRGTLSLEQGNIDAAERDCEAGRALDDKHPAVVVLQAQIREARGDREGARKLFNRLRHDKFTKFVKSVMMRAEFAIEKRRLELGHKYVQLYRQILPGDSNGHQMLGKLYLLEGEWTKALDELNEAIRQKPGIDVLGSVYLEKAIALHRLQRTDEELACLREAIGLNDECSFAAHMRLAELKLSSRMSAGLLEDANKLRTLQPENRQGLRIRAECLRFLGKFDEAIAQLEEAIALDPEDPISLDLLAWWLSTDSRTPQGEGRRAVELASKACRLTNQADGHIIATLAAAHAKAGDFDSAMALMLKAIDKSTGGDREDRERMLALIKERRAIVSAP